MWSVPAETWLTARLEVRFANPPRSSGRERPAAVERDRARTAGRGRSLQGVLAVGLVQLDSRAPPERERRGRLRRGRGGDRAAGHGGHLHPGAVRGGPGADACTRAVPSSRCPAPASSPWSMSRTCPVAHAGPVIATSTAVVEVADALLPSWPPVPRPQHEPGVKPVVQVKAVPALIVVRVRPESTPVAVTATGAVRCVVLEVAELAVGVERPSRTPARRRPRSCGSRRPRSTVTVRPDRTPDAVTATGAVRCVVPESPSWPLVLRPQQNASPSATAQVWEPPAEIDGDRTPVQDAGGGHRHRRGPLRGAGVAEPSVGVEAPAERQPVGDRAAVGRRPPRST